MGREALWRDNQQRTFAHIHTSSSHSTTSPWSPIPYPNCVFNIDRHPPARVPGRRRGHGDSDTRAQGQCGTPRTRGVGSPHPPRAGCPPTPRAIRGDCHGGGGYRYGGGGDYSGGYTRGGQCAGRSGLTGRLCVTRDKDSARGESRHVANGTALRDTRTR